MRWIGYLHPVTFFAVGPSAQGGMLHVREAGREYAIPGWTLVDPDAGRAVFRDRAGRTVTVR